MAPRRSPCVATVAATLSTTWISSGSWMHPASSSSPPPRPEDRGPLRRPYGPEPGPPRLLPPGQGPPDEAPRRRGLRPALLPVRHPAAAFRPVPETSPGLGESCLIHHFLMQGHDLANVQGTRNRTHRIRFSKRPPRFMLRELRLSRRWCTVRVPAPRTGGRAKALPVNVPQEPDSLSRFAWRSRAAWSRPRRQTVKVETVRTAEAVRA